VTHGGGAQFSTTSATYATFLAWITAGAPMGSTSSTPATPTTPTTPPPGPISYATWVAPIIGQCTGCHDGVHQSPDFTQGYSQVVKDVVPGSSATSQLCTITASGHSMAGYLTAQQHALMVQWVDNGAGP
jgi:hypothetical protein